MNTDAFQIALDQDDFLITVELLATRNDGLDNFHHFIDQHKSNYKADLNCPKIVAITVPQSPGGVPTIDPFSVLNDLDLPDDLSAIAHVSCKDLNRNGMESHLKDLRRIGTKNLLALTGDVPIGSKPVFELESLSLLRMIADLNAHAIAQTPPDRLDSVFQFFAGAAINPFKYTLGSAWQQYAKMIKKIYSGAKFLISQVGFDIVKSTNLIRYIDAHELDIPIFGNVFTLTKTAVQRMHDGAIPGTFASDDLFEIVSNEWKSKSKGRIAMIKRSAQQIAFFRTIGYKGVHVGGFGLTFDDLAEMISQSQAIYENQEIDEYRDNIHFPPSIAEYFIDPEGEFILPENPPKPTIRQRVLQLSHDVAVNPNSIFGKTIGTKKTDQNTITSKLLHGVERSVKGILVNCENCGDCFLPENYYAICTEASCAKGLLNVPCGDSDAITGLCGNDGGTVCAGEMVFYAAFAVGKLRELETQINAQKISELRGTSAVINYFSGIDHRGRIAGKVREKKPIDLIEIGESLHAQIPRVKWAMSDLIGKKNPEVLDGSLAFLIDVINSQISAGAEYIAINVDDFSAEIRSDLMRKYVALVNSLSENFGGIPVCIDSSDPNAQRAGIEEYYRSAKNRSARLPIVNSINIAKPQQILDLKSEFEFKVIGMLHEKLDENGNAINIKTADESHKTAKQLFDLLTKNGFDPGHVFFDTAVVPIATDIEATMTRKVLKGIEKIMNDREMKGVHTLIGLSNCSHMMPNRIAINRAYLHVAMEFGLDSAVLDPTIDYGMKTPGKKISSIIKELADNDGSDPEKSFAIFDEIAEYSRKYGRKN